MQTAQRQSYFFTYRYWFPVAALAATAHLRLCFSDIKSAFTTKGRDQVAALLHF
jgi:hypothetical protein